MPEAELNAAHCPSAPLLNKPPRPAGTTPRTCTTRTTAFLATGAALPCCGPVVRHAAGHATAVVCVRACELL